MKLAPCCIYKNNEDTVGSCSCVYVR
jgi:hypothetical protein